MLVIGIAGGTGSGKTTVVNKILQQLNAEGVNVLSQDNYYHDNQHLSLTEREALNYDHPKSIDFDLLLKHVRALKNKESIEQPIYSFVTHSRTGDHVLVEPKNVLIVEGILVLTHPELLKEYNLKVFVHADSDERLIRRIRRDTQERGRDLGEVLHRYQTTTGLPGHFHRSNFRLRFLHVFLHLLRLLHQAAQSAFTHHGMSIIKFLTLDVQFTTLTAVCARTDAARYNYCAKRFL